MKRMTRNRRRKTATNLRHIAFSGGGLLAIALLIIALLWLQDNGLEKIPIEVEENPGQFLFYDALKNSSEDSSVLMPLDPQKPEKKGRSEPSSDRVPPEAASPMIKIRAQPAEKTFKGSRSYSVQVAALKDRPAAQDFADELIKKGYKAYLVSYDGPENQPWYRVRIGRFKDQRQAQHMAAQLSKFEGLSGFVVINRRSRG